VSWTRTAQKSAKKDTISSDMKKIRAYVISTVFAGGFYGCSGIGKTDFAFAESIASCSMSPSPPIVEVRGPRILLQVKPTSASNCISKNNEPHQAYVDSAVPSKELLAVFLPGTGGTPAQFPAFLQHGSTRGYNVIGLSYSNDQSVTVMCNSAKRNADCAGEVRDEILTGRDASNLISISNADSIEGRLTALLRYLHHHRPRDGWGQFISEQGAVAWDKIVVSGNSQGAGHAAYMAKTRRVHRVGVYAGPSDWVNETNSPVNWYHLPSLTPASVYFGFVHSPDRLANSSGNPMQVTDVWKDFFGMEGVVTKVGATTAQHGASQRLITTACTGAGTVNEHNCPMMRGNEMTWNLISYP
jgi:hypothetical protein